MEGNQTSSAPEGARPAWVDDGLFPFRSRFVTLDGHTVHYVDEGSGPTLLMLHGNPTWSFLYREVIKRLSDRFRCVAVDYPGFGLSRAAPGYRSRPEDHARVVADLIPLLDLNDVTVVVQDWGGPIGVHAAARNRDRIAALVVGNSWAWPVNGDLHYEIFSKVMGGPLGRALIRRYNIFVTLMVPAGHRLRKPTPAEMAHYREALPDAERRRGTSVFPRSITSARGFLASTERDLAVLRDLPALVLWADRDTAFREKERERWEQALPNHRTVILPGVGHFLQTDAPEEFSDAIAAWHPLLKEDR